MGVDHRRAHVLVAQQLLDRPNIIPIFKQVGRKGVAKRMAACRLADPCFQSGFLEAALQDGFVQVVPALFAGESVGVVAGRLGAEQTGRTRARGQLEPIRFHSRQWPQTMNSGDIIHIFRRRFCSNEALQLWKSEARAKGMRLAT